MRLQIMNCYNDKINVDIGKLKDILSISVTVLSGDEVLHVVKKNGEIIEEDSDRHGRCISFYDGQYTIYNSSIGLNKIKAWRKRQDSNDGIRLALDVATGKGIVVKGRRMTDSESTGMLFDDAPDIPDHFIPPLN